MKLIRIFAIAMLSFASVFMLAGTAQAEETPVPQPRTYDVSYCQRVTNPYHVSDSQWWTYQQFINRYKESCSITPDWAGSWSGAWGQWRNGAIPPENLTFVNDSFLLKDDAAQAFSKMDKSYFNDTGKHLQVNEAYRPYIVQWSTWTKDVRIAAYPGTSGHGWGTSLDLATAGDYESQGKWLKANAEKFDWINPEWAHDGVSPEEPWHFDYKESSHPKICTSIWANNCSVL